MAENTNHFSVSLCIQTGATPLALDSSSDGSDLCNAGFGSNTLAVTLYNTGLGEGLFIVSCLLVLVTVVTQGLKTRPRGIEIGVALGIAAAYLLIFVRMAVPTERSHLIEYGVVAVFIYEALTERASQGKHVPVPSLLAILATSLLGVIDECIQIFLPSRVFDPQDILFNVLAAVMAVTGSVALGWARRWNG